MGIPSTMINGWFCPRIELVPRTTMRAEPNGFEEFVTWTPATLPPSDAIPFCVGTPAIRSPETVCAEYERLLGSRSMPSAVTTTCVSSMAPSASVMSCSTEAPVSVSGTVFVVYPVRRAPGAGLHQSGHRRRFLRSRDGGNQSEQDEPDCENGTNEPTIVGHTLPPSAAVFRTHD